MNARFPLAAAALAAVAALTAPVLTAPAAHAGDVAGQFDYYVLALSWSPSWCATDGQGRNEPQCEPRRRTGFVVHGLWPQYERGWPANCATPERDPSRRESQAMADVMGSGGLAVMLAALSAVEASNAAARIGYPVLLRPSYVLGGRAMEIVDSDQQLDDYIQTAVQVSGDSPVLIDQYLRDAVEVDVDAIGDGDQVVVAGVLQHIEEAGVHSGDSACSIPPYSLSAEIIVEIERQTEALARGLNVVGLMNIQFAVKDGQVYLIEVNPRASRTVPFVAKAIGAPIAKIAARVMAGEKLRDLPPIDRRIDYVAVKEAVFPFNRFPGIDPVLSPEMKSTGEVMGIDRDFTTAFAKAQLGAGTVLPSSGAVFVSVKDSDKPLIVPVARQLVDAGLTIVATGGTADYLTRAGLPTAVAPAGTGLVTTAFEPTLAPAPTVKPPSTCALAPTITPASSVGWRLAPRASEVPPSVTPW